MEEILKITRAPLPPGMEEVLTRGCNWEQQASSTQEQQRQAAKGQGHGPLTPFPHGQPDWKSIKARLPAKTLLLERTEPMFKELLDDGRLHMHQTQTTSRIVLVLWQRFRQRIASSLA